MVTASLDNLVIFWNSYTRKEAKHIQLTDDIASKQKGTSVQQVKFAASSNDDFVLLFLSNGEIFVVDRQTEDFVEPPDFEDGTKAMHPLSFGKVPQFAVVDLSDGIILSCSEQGEGCIHRVAIKDQKAVQGARRQPSGRTVVIEFYKAFKCKNITEMRRGGPSNIVFNTQLNTKFDFFSIAQRDGTVAFYSISECKFLAFLNQATWDKSVGRLLTTGSYHDIQPRKSKTYGRNFSSTTRADTFK